MSRWDIRLSGHTWFAGKACSVCGKSARHHYLMHVHIVMEFRQLEQILEGMRTPNRKRSNERLCWELCMGCSERLANQLDKAIDEARRWYRDGHL